MAETYYVSPRGSDAWSGRLDAPAAGGGDGPWATVAHAAAQAQPGDTVILRQGVYRQTLTPARSGTAEAPIVFAAYRDEEVTLSGADPITDWRSDDGRTYHATLPTDLKDGNQVFVAGRMLDQARWPVSPVADAGAPAGEHPGAHPGGDPFDPARAHAAGGSTGSLTDPNLPDDIDLTGAVLWCTGGSKWIGWAAVIERHDRAARTLHFTLGKNYQHDWYKVIKGSEYVVMDLPRAIAPGQWWVDRQTRRLHLWPHEPGDPSHLAVEAKSRTLAVDLRGRQHVQVIGLRLFAAGLATDDQSQGLLLRGLHGRYLGHSYQHDVSHQQAVLLRGQGHRLENCDLGYSSGSLLQVSGSDHRVTNCHLHHGNYGAKWNGAVALGGRRLLFSHNTVAWSGRDLLTLMRLSQSLLEYNDLSRPGVLTHDLGMTYGHTTDYRGTTIRFNAVHDNLAKGTAMGIYFDHVAQHAVVHHNEIWNVGRDPVRLNNPGAFLLVYHNSCHQTGTTGTFDHSDRDDLSACRMQNNVLNQPITLPAEVVAEPNLVTADPGYVDAAGHDFTLRPGSAAASGGAALAGLVPGETGGGYLGAYAPGAARRKVGHDFANPPVVPESWELTRAPYANAIDNACFEFSLESWESQSPELTRTVAGNEWGNQGGQGKAEPTATGHHELALGPGRAGVSQRVTGLRAGVRHRLWGWLRVTDPAQQVRLSVAGQGMSPVEQATSSTTWTRLELAFIPPPQGVVTVRVEKVTDGPGQAHADNLGLPREP